MSFIKRTAKKIQRQIICICKINWVKFIKNYSTRKGIIILIPTWIKAFFKNELELDLLLLAALVNSNKKFQIYSGRHYKKFRGRTILYNIHQGFNFEKAINCAEVISAIATEMEKYNQVSPSSYESLFWENKTFMYKAFENLNIKTPQTTIVPINADLSSININFPCLIKEEHSRASQGIYKVNNIEDVKTLISQTHFQKYNQHIIFQELLDMRKDLRVILIGSDIVLHYWRLNTSKEWKPTSTSHGSNVDFISFPEKWRQHIITEFKKLNLTTGAFDIAWQNDELETEPYFLEVSPSYQPNPPADLTGKKFHYGQFKKKFMLINSWDKKYMDIEYQLKDKLIQYILN